jgi:hypothetical protein
MPLVVVVYRGFPPTTHCRKVDKPKILTDACVLAVAEELKKDNWEVKANVEGYSKPSKVGPLVPDIVAQKKGCLKRICQIATPEMFDGNKDRYHEFKDYCDEYDFHFYIVEKNGTRKEVDPQSCFKGK